MNFINLDLFLLDKAIKRVLCGGNTLNDSPISILDFKHCELKRIPKEIGKFRKCLEELYLDSNMICEMSRVLFQCQMLKKLTLSDNEIYIMPSWISCLWNIRELNVSKNALLDIPYSIRNCKFLHTLDLSVNPLGRVPEGITHIVALTHLFMNDCFLDYLPASFGRLTQLLVLELRSNNIKYLPKSFIHLSTLERLDIGGNDLTDLAEFFGSLVSLEELWVDRNKVRRLPQSFGHLVALEFAELSCNCLSEIPDTICRLSKLRELYLNENMIGKLPADLGKLSSLTILNLSDNCLSELPTSIGGLHELIELNVTKNQLTTLPSEFNRLANLRFLYVASNKLTTLPKEIGFCAKLRVLSLANNQLTNIPAELGMCRHLRVLNVVQNRLTELPYALTNCKLLNALWLSENQGTPLLPFQAETNEQGQKILTSYMFPQQRSSPSAGAQLDLEVSNYAQDVSSDVESLTSSVWDAEYRKRCKVAFKFDSDHLQAQADKGSRTVYYPKESNFVRGQKLTPVHLSYSDEHMLGPKTEFYPEGVVTYFVSNHSSPKKNRLQVPLMTSSGGYLVERNGVASSYSTTSHTQQPPHLYQQHGVGVSPLVELAAYKQAPPTAAFVPSANQCSYLVTNTNGVRVEHHPKNHTKSMETLVN